MRFLCYSKVCELLNWFDEFLSFYASYRFDVRPEANDWLPNGIGLYHLIFSLIFYHFFHKDPCLVRKYLWGAYLLSDILIPICILFHYLQYECLFLFEESDYDQSIKFYCSSINDFFSSYWLHLHFECMFYFSASLWLNAASVSATRFQS